MLVRLLFWFPLLCDVGGTNISLLTLHRKNRIKADDPVCEQVRDVDPVKNKNCKIHLYTNPKC